MRGLIDGDIVAYRAASVMREGVDWGDGESSAREPLPPGLAADAACQTIDAWARMVGCKDPVVAFTGRNNWRKRIMPSYKANRAGKVKPQHYAYVVNAVRDRFETRLVDGLEADDLLGIMATSPKYAGAVVLTIDKDLRTVPGLHLNPLKDDKPVLVRVAAADRSWMLQTLTGDTSDGYTGIPKVGEKKALKILGGPASLGSMWPQVVAAYQSAGLTELDALTTARVARILRSGDYDKKTREVLLWHPTATPQRLALKE